MIAIRVDANEYIASGHVMRCLSIADALFDLDEDILFFTSDEFAVDIIEKRGYKVIKLISVWDDKDGELDEMIEKLDKYKTELLLIDSYQVTEHYLRCLHNRVKIAYIDDLNSFDYPVDVVINYSINADAVEYSKNKKYLLGIKYAPLRKQFDVPEERLEEVFRQRSNNKQILITSGAADPYRVVEDITWQILKQPDLAEYRIAVVKGKLWNTDAFDMSSELLSSQRYMNRITVYENVGQIAKLMLESSIAVSAGGSTLYELLACCVPTITFSFVDNQFENVKGFAEKGIMEYVGDVRTVKDIGAKIVFDILKLHNSTERITHIFRKMKDIRCVNGASNIAIELKG